MSKVRKISRIPKKFKNYYLVDACFLANKYIPVKIAPNNRERERIEYCLQWWKEIEKQLENKMARVYVPDICIAETFKVLSKKYYEQKWFRTPQSLNNARLKFRKDIVNKPSKLSNANRVIKYHDLPTSRDIIISVDRFYRLFMIHNHKVSLPDLLIVGSAKYLLDFYDLPKQNMHIVTLDKALWQGSKKIQELPNAYDPTKRSDYAERVFY